MTRWAAPSNRTVKADVWTLVLVGAVLLLGSYAQAATGTGLGLISGSILVIVLGRESGIALLSILSVVMMTAVLVQNWKATRWKDGLMLGASAVLLTPLLAIGLRHFDQALLLLVGGVLVIASVGALSFGLSSPALTGPVGAVGAGALSALMNMLSGAGGPPPVLYAVNSKWTPPETRATLQLVFILVAFTSLGSLGLPSVGAKTVGVAAATTALGTVAGMASAKRIPAAAARAAVLSLAALGGVTMLTAGALDI